MRKTKLVKIEAEGRDKGKLFQITEMSARSAELWALRGFRALVKAGVEVPDEVKGTGMAAFAKIGLEIVAHMDLSDAVELGDELMACVKICRDPAHPEASSVLLEDDVEEAKTRVTLKLEAFGLHTDFSMADVLSKLNSPSAPAKKTAKT